MSRRGSEEPLPPRQSPDNLSTGSQDHHRTSSNRFKFKSIKSKRCVGANTRSGRRRHHHHRRHAGHHRYGSRRGKSESQDPQPAPISDDPSNLQDADAAFRESLFDAMGDDEGAAYWESIYGQPIHNYPAQKLNEGTGKLEKMSEEEYIAFVRAGMWERSREGIEAKRKEEERKKRKAERAHREGAYTRLPRQKGSKSAFGQEAGGTTAFEWEIEDSLRRGQERRDKKLWREKWEAYENAWNRLYHLADASINDRSTTKLEKEEEQQPSSSFHNEIIWPVESGRRKDLNPAEIERFMHKSADSLSSTGDEADRTLSHLLLSILKLERVRWHPDKVQHRFGPLDGGDQCTSVMRSVTEVFQVMDRMYNEMR